MRGKCCIRRITAGTEQGPLPQRQRCVPCGGQDRAICGKDRENRVSGSRDRENRVSGSRDRENRVPGSRDRENRVPVSRGRENRVFFQRRRGGWRWLRE